MPLDPACGLFSLLLRLPELFRARKKQDAVEPPNKTLHIAVIAGVSLPVAFSTSVHKKLWTFPNLGLANPGSLSQDDVVEQSGIKWSAAE